MTDKQMDKLASLAMQWLIENHDKQQELSMLQIIAGYLDFIRRRYPVKEIKHKEQLKNEK